MHESWTSANRDNWDARALAHLEDPGPYYDLPALRSGASSLLPIERELMGDPRGLRILHLMCHLGLDSISWARMGARVTAVDLSPRAIDLARTLARECGASVDFHVADVHDLPGSCAGPFDAVILSYGVLCWLRDLPKLMGAVRERLVDGGRLLLVDGHPFVSMIADDPTADGWRLHGDCYFFRGEPDRLECATSYTGEAPLAKPVNFQWPHHVAEIVQAVLGAGLTLRALREEPFGFYPRFPGMTRRADGYWELPAGSPRIPLLLALMAVRQAPGP